MRSLICLLLFGYGTGVLASSTIDALLSKRIRIEKTMEMFEATEGTSLEASARDEFLKKKRASLLSQMESLVAKPGKSSQKLELKLRLAKIYMEDYYSTLAKSKNSKEFDEARQFLKKPRMLYSSMLQEYPKDSRRDQMLYFLALTSLDVNLPKEAIRLFEEITTHFPKSTYRFDALVQVGDYYFEQNNFAKADLSYAALIREKYLPEISGVLFK